MGYPLILYGLAEIGNWSFELDVDGTDPPSSWTDLGTSGIQEVDDAYFHSAGDGIPSAQSLKQNVLADVGGNKAVTAQRFAIADLLTIARENEIEIAAAACLRPESQVGLENAVIRLKQYDGTSDTPGVGSLQTAPLERMFFAGGPVWYLAVAAAKIAAATTRVDLELVYDIARAGYDASGSIWWDRVFLGGLVDFPKRFRGGFSSRLDSGQRANEGDGETELVRVRGPRTQVDADMQNVLDSSDLGRQLKAFNRWIGKGLGFCALWRDRENSTNADEHYQRAHVDRRYRVIMPAGPTRRNYDFRFIASQEANA